MHRAVGTADLAIERWGLVPYEEALARQLRLHDRVLAGDAPDTLVVVEHPATFTLGRQAPEADIILDRMELARRGIGVARSDRGGRATYHGPGQIVVYPIVAIARLGLGVKDWVCQLEGSILDTLQDYGIAGHRRPATAGIWTEPDGGSKIASLGLRVARGVSYHGLALNTGLDASVFDCIVTCGVRGESVTTMEKELGRRPVDDEVSEKLLGHLTRRIREVQQGQKGQQGRAASGQCAIPTES